MILLNSRLLIFVLSLTFQKFQLFDAADDNGVTLPSKCETCKFLALELEGKFDETGKTNEVLQLTSSLGSNIKTKKYRNSELRLIETLENLCDRILQYNMHKEHKNSNRFAKGQSMTMKTLHGLVEKGVKVELGIPYDLWDSPSVEVTTMKQYCEQILEQYEEVIERWFFDENEQKPTLRKYLCEDRVLKTAKDRSCLNEEIEKKKGDDGKVEENIKEITKKTEPVVEQPTKKIIEKAKTIQKNRKGDDEL